MSGNEDYLDSLLRQAMNRQVTMAMHSDSALLAEMQPLCHRDLPKEKKLMKCWQKFEFVQKTTRLRSGFFSLKIL